MGYHVIHKRRTRRSQPHFRVDNTGPGRHPVRMSEQDRKRLGDAIRVRRGQLRMTQKDFAQRAGVDSKQIIRIEQGKVEPRAGTLDGLDTASLWEPGTALAILNDREPPGRSVQNVPPADPEERAIYDSLFPLPHDERMRTVAVVMEQRRHRGTGT